MGVQSLGWKDPLEKGAATHSSILAWRIRTDRGAWWAIVHGVAKSQTRLSNFNVSVLQIGASLVAQLVKNPPAMQEIPVRFLGGEDLLEEVIATHSSILAWRIPWERGARWATIHRVTKSWTQLKQLSMHTSINR